MSILLPAGGVATTTCSALKLLCFHVNAYWQCRIMSCFVSLLSSYVFFNKYFYACKVSDLFQSRLYGSYAAIQGTMVNWALQNLTGGISDSVLYRDNRNILQKTIDISMARSTLLAATIAVSVAVNVCHNSLQEIFRSMIAG